MDETGDWANEVRLVGRLSAVPDERELPSGDVVVGLRLVVPRSARTSGRASSPSRPGASVDTIDVSCWTGRTRQRARRLQVGDVVEVAGSLRRRFYRAGAATLSRYEVEASGIVTVSRAGRAAG